MKSVTIKLCIDSSCRHADVFVSGKLNYSGNFWDYRNEVHGLYDMEGFYGPHSYVGILKRKFKKEGVKKIKVITKKGSIRTGKWKFSE